MVIMEPVQNAGGSFMPPAGYFEGVREICDRYGILLVRRRGDHGLRPGRALVCLRALRHPARHDHDAPRGSRRRYAAIGALIVSDRVMEPFMKPAGCTRTA